MGDTYKLKIWTSCDDGGKFKDLYLDVSHIVGFFIPDDTEEMGPAINLFLYDDLITVKQEQHITKYLTERFVDNVIKV